jgi:hypothetical protein
VKVWIGGEVDVSAVDALREARAPLQRMLSELLADRDYGPALRDIGYIPIIMGGPFDGMMRERRLFQRKQSACDYRTEVPYVAFRDGTVEQRQALLLRGLIEAIEDVHRKARRGFEAEQLVADILAAVGHTKTSLGVRASQPIRRRPA